MDDRDKMIESAKDFYVRWMKDPDNADDTWGTAGVLADFTLEQIAKREKEIADDHRGYEAANAEWLQSVCRPQRDYNPDVPIENVIFALASELKKVEKWDGAKTAPIRIWILRRSLEKMIDMQRQIARLEGESASATESFDAHYTTNGDACRKCGGKLRFRENGAIVNEMSGIPDFIGGEIMTVSPDPTRPKLVHCWKCEDCGWSVTAGKEKET